MIPISNADAKTIRDLLERGNKFYSNHATSTRHINDGRRMAQQAKKLSKKLTVLQQNCSHKTKSK